MPIYAKQGGTWSRGNSPQTKQIYAKQSGLWYRASAIYAKWGGNWIGTDYLGTPNSPVLPSGWGSIISSAADNFSTVTLGYWGPSSGPAPTGYIHRMYNSSYGLLAQIGPGDAGYQAGGATFNVSQNTAYVFRVYSVNAAGESVGYLEARYAIGHVQQTRQDAVYGWQAEYDYGVDVTYASSQLDDHQSGMAVDWKNNPSGCWTTNWMGVARAANWMMEAVRLYPVVGRAGENTRLMGVRVWPSYGVQLFIGLYSDFQAPGAWIGSDFTPNQTGLWVDGAAYNTFGVHPYLVHGAFNGGNEYHYRPADAGFDFRASHMVCDVVVWDLNWNGAAYYGGLLEVIFRMSDYGIVGYNTVVTVNQQNNYYW